MVFRDRSHAGQELASKLGRYAGSDCIVYALPRGGVPVAYEIARALNAPLDLVVARKIGHPLSPEYGVGAISEGGCLVANDAEVARLGEAWFRDAAERERRIAERNRIRYCGKQQIRNAKGKIAIVVDDGIATGYTLRAALAELRGHEPEKLVVAVPVAPADTARALAQEVDELVVGTVPEFGFGAVGSFYEDFRPISDEEVVRLLQASYTKGATG